MNLLLTGGFRYTEDQIKDIQHLGYNVFYMESEKFDLLPLSAKDIDAIVCNHFFLSHNFSDFPNLKIIQLLSAGLDRVPVEDIRNSGCALFNARGVYSIPMAEWVLFRVLEYFKKGVFFWDNQKKGRWIKHRGLREICGSSVAIIGAGNVGMEVAKRFNALGARVDGFDVHTEKTQYFNNMRLTSTLNSEIKNYDIIIITAPLLPSTKGIVSRDILFSLKENAILINISRGELVDQESLCEVLDIRRDIFVALDVFDSEPLSEDSVLWKLENVAISPHNSFVSDRNNERMFNVMYHNLKKCIQN